MQLTADQIVEVQAAGSKAYTAFAAAAVRVCPKHTADANTLVRVVIIDPDTSFASLTISSRCPRTLHGSGSERMCPKRTEKQHTFNTCYFRGSQQPECAHTPLVRRRLKARVLQHTAEQACVST